jgi:hypothetical protein
MTTLIFPAGMPGAISYLHICTEQKKQVVGASSLQNDPSREQYSNWAFLPYVTDATFSSKLKHLLISRVVTEVFTANPTVWNILNNLLPEIAPNVSLVGDSPVRAALATYRSSRVVAGMLWNNREFLHLDGSVQVRISQMRFSALVHHTNTIPGMCDHQKLLALSEIFRDTPVGDVVEIGSWWGKSAFILTFLAQQYGIGATLCVDPWELEHALQGVPVLNDFAEEMCVEEGHQVFLDNLIPYAHGNLNYLRLPSVEAATEYRKGQFVTSEAFGTTEYAGKIAVLHIDGNHKQEAVEADFSSWGDLVVDGGWIIFDDYRWLYGDGPKIVADRLFQSRCDQIQRAFCMGGAMFIKIGTSSA